MVKTLLKGLLARVLGYGALVSGFWFLLRGFLGPNVALAILGCVMILGGMYLIVTARRGAVALPTAHTASNEEDKPR